MKIIIKYLLMFLMMSITCYGQGPSAGNLFESTNPFGTDVFIENMGQFNDPLITDQIYFGFGVGEENIFFTNRGLVHKFTKTYDYTEEELEEMEEGHGFPKGKAPETFFMTMRWANSNPDYTIEKSERQSYYFTYGSPDLNSYGYKKIKCVNVYNNIDIEYAIPADKSYGIKYNIILRPGANPDDIKIEYSGTSGNMEINDDGNVVIPGPVRNITEYVPKSYYNDGEEILVKFTVSENRIGFNLDKTDPSRTIIIDPWVTSISGLGANNNAYDIDYDNSGNVFVYGGGSTSVLDMVSKYNSSGVLQWTFAGSVSSPAWTSNNGSIGLYDGNFVVRRSDGKTYVGKSTSGFTQGLVIRLNAAGNYDNFVTAIYSNIINEVWDMGYNPSTGNVYIFGGGTSTNSNVTIVNQTTGTLNPVSFNNDWYSGIDLVSNTIDSNGEIYMTYATWTGISPGDKIAKVNSSFTSTLWTVPSTYGQMWKEGANKNTFLGIGYSGQTTSSNGFNCLAVNANYLFYYDGYNLAAYDKSTGTKVGYTTVPLTVKQQGGIAINSTCDYIYVGGNNAILVYTFNGISFTAQTSISAGASSGAYIYDLKLDNSTGILYYSGKGIVGSYVISLATCSPTGSAVQGCMGVPLSFNTTNCSSSFPYVWNFGDASPTYTGSSASHQYAGLGTYVVSVTTNGACNTVAQTFTVSIVVPPSPCTPSLSSISNNCGTLLNLNTTNCNSALSYTWNFGDGSPVFVGLTAIHQYAGLGNYVITVTTNGNCNTVAQVINVSVVAPPPFCSPANTSTLSCLGAPVNFNTTNCSSSSPYIWNFGDGSPIQTGATTQHQYYNLGSYVVTITTNGSCNTVAQTINVTVMLCAPTIPPCYDCIGSFAPVPGKKYILSAWAKENSPAQSKTSYTYPGITILYPSISGSAGPFLPSGNIIDGWQRIEGEFIIPSNATDITVKLDCSNSDCYYDDIRVLPFDASMKSYVYDPVTMRLVAELDERNYATLYEYDEEGKLIRVKKETEKGKMTIKENRDNTKK